MTYYIHYCLTYNKTDKRFSHAPPVAENSDRKRNTVPDGEAPADDDTPEILGACESCQKPWDKYRGKRRCPACGVPLLVCKECDATMIKRDRNIRCDLCVKEGEFKMRND